MAERRQLEVTYEFIEQTDAEHRLRHAYEILTRADVECIAARVVVPSDEIGESTSPPNIDIDLNTRKPTVDPSRRRAAYER